ncbi:DUF748 domain-containing protein [Ideonella sp. YS5]|uniref:DUF748 domain-containing protein n=1 Tax=Ideonella sp. YS5 TaxID=3453714 RepID=UPI003EEF6C63
MRLEFLARRRRALVALAVGLVLPVLLSWLVLPWCLRGFAEARASAQLGRQVTIQGLRINPLRLSLGMDGVTIAGPAGDANPQLKLAHADINADLRSLWRRAPVIEAVELQGLDVRLARVADGRYDFDDVMARLRPAEPAAHAEPARFALYNLRLSDGSIRFDDRPKGRVHEVRAIQLGLPFLSNLEDAVDVKVEPQLAFELDGAAFDTGAQAKPFARDREGTVTLKTGDIDVAAWLPYLPADLPVRPVAGQVAVDLSVQFWMPPDVAPKVSVKGELRAKGVRVADAAGTTWAEFKALSLQLADAEPLMRRARLGTVTVDGLDVLARRDEAGRVNWMQAMAPGQPAPSAEPPPTSAAQPWQFGLARLSLRDSRLRWQDEAVRPASRLAMESLQLELQALQWPTDESTLARLKAQASLSSGEQASRTVAAPTWQATGEWNGAGGRLQLQGSDWPLGWAAPYVASRLRSRIDGRLGFDLTALWQGAPGAATPTLQLASLQVDDFQAAEPGDRRPAVGWKQLRLADVTLDFDKRGMSLGELAWQQPTVRARRDAAGRIDLAQWWKNSEAAETPSSGAAAGGDTPWHVQLKRASVAGGRVAWLDEAAGEAGPAALELQALALDLRDLGWPAAAGAQALLQGSAQVTSGGQSSPGRLSWKGELGQSPWSWRGSARIERFPAHAVASYAGALPVVIARAEVGWTGQVAARAEPAGLRLALQGDARVGDLSLYPRAGAQGPRSGEELLSWQLLELPKLKVDLVPGGAPKVEMGEGRLNDFYARLAVDESGHFNLADLNSPSPAAGVPALPGPAASAATAASAPLAGAPALELSVGGLQLANGRVDFSDHFVKPNYSAALSDLSGRLGAFRTGTREMAPLELRGKVAGTAQLEVRGALNPTAKPLALDVQAKATELELAPLSPYAGKYAGYAIERGKLSMDVSYRIDPDGHLDAKNQIVLNQLTFGDRIDSPEATKLPVLLAVALLKDRNGVIDLNLPIGGSLNDPDFSIGSVVLKLIGNLLTKAITSPFALLTGGDAEDLSQVEFVPGTSRLAPSASAVLDKVARSLADRPGLQMTVTGAADPLTERDAMQGAWLDERLSLERRKDQLRADAAASAPAGVPTADERVRLVRRLYADTKLPGKPRNVLGLAKDIPPAEMEALLRASYVVSTDNARELALQRGLAVRDALIAKGLPSERLFLAAPRLRASGEDEAHWTPRVQLSLATP